MKERHTHSASLCSEADICARSVAVQEFFKGDMKKKGKVSLGDRADVDRNICGLADKHGMAYPPPPLPFAPKHASIP